MISWRPPLPSHHRVDLDEVIALAAVRLRDAVTDLLDLVGVDLDPRIEQRPLPQLLDVELRVAHELRVEVDERLQQPELHHDPAARLLEVDRLHEDVRLAEQHLLRLGHLDRDRAPDAVPEPGGDALGIVVTQPLHLDVHDERALRRGVVGGLSLDRRRGCGRGEAQQQGREGDGQEGKGSAHGSGGPGWPGRGRLAESASPEPDRTGSSREPAAQEHGDRVRSASRPRLSAARRRPPRAPAERSPRSARPRRGRGSWAAGGGPGPREWTERRARASGRAGRR